MADPIRFRTQDTRQKWATKINALVVSPVPKLREVPQTLTQWAVELNALSKAASAAGYVIPSLASVFRLSDTRQMWARKLNLIAVAMEAGTIPVNTVLPTISGTATVGQVLTATAGTWTGVATITYAYQWLRDGVVISRATSSTYTLVSADQTHKLSVKVTATNSLGSATATSAQTATVS
jgi:hypothetical protein